MSAVEDATEDIVCDGSAGRITVIRIYRAALTDSESKVPSTVESQSNWVVPLRHIIHVTGVEHHGTPGKLCTVVEIQH